MQLEEKAKVWGGTFTVIFYILLLLLLLFCCFERVEVKEEDGWKLLGEDDDYDCCSYDEDRIICEDGHITMM